MRAGGAMGHAAAAVVPFRTQPTFELAGHVVHAFGLLVFVAIVVGVLVARRRCVREGLDLGIGENIALTAVVVGITSAHVFDVLAYHPEIALREPLELLRFWGDLSSFGGILGALLGMAIALRLGPARTLDGATRLRYLDCITYGFAMAWGFGRLGCTLAIDHPGRVTDFPLATSLATPESMRFIHDVYLRAGRLTELPYVDPAHPLGFHNLGFYEWIYTVAVVVPAFALWGRVPRAPGFFVAAFLLLYAPMRFAMDFLRIGDRTYAGLTPGQYAAVAITVTVLATVAYRRRVRPREA